VLDRLFQKGTDGRVGVAGVHAQDCMGV
jgi:hypothetical protein